MSATCQKRATERHTILNADIKNTQDGTRVLVDLYGIERLQRILGKGLTRDDIVLDATREMGSPLSCVKVVCEEADYQAYLTAIPARLLADLYEKYATRLFEFNVRAFLGVRGRNSVNAGLRQCSHFYKCLESVIGGRYWTLTSDPCDVNTVLYQLS